MHMAVNCLVTDASRNIVLVVLAMPNSRLAKPYALAKTMFPFVAINAAPLNSSSRVNLVRYSSALELKLVESAATVAAVHRRGTRANNAFSVFRWADITLPNL